MYKYIKENRVKVLFVPLVIYWLLLFIATSIPSDHLSQVLQIGDKLKHFFAYLILGFLLSLALHFQQKWENLSTYAFISSFFICVVYGAFDELHQIDVPNRSAELLDWFADALGSILGVIFAMIMLRRIKTGEYQAET